MTVIAEALRIPAHTHRRVAAWLCGLGLAWGALVTSAQPPSTPPSAPRAAPTPPIYLDISDAAGLDFRHDHGGTGMRYLPETMGSGGCVLDLDGDGWMDLYLVQSGPVPSAQPTTSSESKPSKPGNRLFRNRGDGTFEDVADAVGGGHTGYGQGAVCADYDGDGDTDVYVTNLGANILLRNDGGRLKDVTAEAGVGETSWNSSATFFDGDGDGDLDLYVVGYLRFSASTHRDCRHLATDESIYCHPDVYPAAADTYYQNQSDGTFKAHTVEAGLTAPDGKGLGVVALDMDRDGHQDLYVTNDSTPNFLYRNLGQGRFAEEGLFLGAAFNGDGKTEAGMGIDAGDVNGDGWTDLMVTNLSLESNALYLGGPDGFSYATRRAGLHGPSYAVLGFGTHLADLDADGHLDLIVINGDVLDNIQLINDSLTWKQPGQIFRGDGQGAFELLSAERTGDLARPRVGRGSGLVDIDNDGRLDLWVSYSGDRARLYAHRGETGHWIGFSLEAHGPNPQAIGAQVTVLAGTRQARRQLRAGSSYLSSSDPRLHFGLGTHRGAVSVLVQWPNGSTDRFDGLAVDQYHVLQQSLPQAQPTREP